MRPAASNRLRQRFGGPPKRSAKAEGPAYDRQLSELRVYVLSKGILGPD